MNKQNCLSSLLESQPGLGLESLLAPATNKTRGQELEEAIVVLRQTLNDLRGHVASDNAKEAIDLALLQTDGLVVEH